MTGTSYGSRTAVFNRGIYRGLNRKIPVGAPKDPISIVGDKLLRKKAQKNETKKNTLEIINNTVMVLHRHKLTITFFAA